MTFTDLDGRPEKPPLKVGPAVRALAGCVARTALLLAERRIHLPRENTGRLLSFGDGSRAVVYRETVVDRGVTHDPAVLVVGFRLRVLRGRAHRWFRVQSILNTPLFVGFPGYVSKLWMTHDEHGVYRGIYEWDGPDRAETYARTLRRVLALGSVPGSIHYRVLTGVHRDELLADPAAYLPGTGPAVDGPPAVTVIGPAGWWRPARPMQPKARLREPV